MLIRVLGRIGADHADGTRFDPPSGPQRRLLALLAMRAGRPVTGETLCDLFDLTPGAVRTSISRLRKQLGGDDVLTTTAAGYVLSAEVDAGRFQSAVTEARSLPLDEASTHLTTALDLFDGPALDEFADEPWAIAEVARLNELRAAVVEDLIAIRIEQGEHDTAIDLLHPHIEAFPFRDRPRELMMEALARSGRQVEALRVYQEYRAHLIEEVGVDPGEAIRELENTIAMGDLPTEPALGRDAGSRPAPAVTESKLLTNLPAVPNEFVGRSAVVAEIAHALTEAPLVTLLGPGGVGKTRLALKVAGGQVGLHSDGVWLVELIDCEGESDILRSIADVLGLRVAGVGDLAEQLAGRTMLLVLDNCEHILGAVHAVVDKILASATRLRILATSRSPLRAIGEQTVAVAPLDVAAAVELYETRSRAVGVDVAASERPIVEEICRQLDGIPLAVELAAASSRVLAPADLRAQLHRRFDLLKGGQRGRSVGRHESLVAAVEWSYEALSEDAQAFFNRLSVFAGEFPLSAVDAVADDLASDSFDLVSELIDMSLLTTQRSPHGSRYRMLETLRQYGVDRLREAGELQAAEDRQIAWCADLVRDQTGAAYGASEAPSIEALVVAVPNLRLAASRLIDRGEGERGLALIADLADLAYAANSLAALAEPLVGRRELADHPEMLPIRAMELLRRSTSGASDSRRMLAEALAAEVDDETPGSVLIPVLLIATALGAGVDAASIDAIESRAGSTDDVAERARLLIAAGFARVYGDDVPSDFALIEDALAAARRAGMQRLAIAAGSMACLAGLRTNQPFDGAVLARQALDDLDDLGQQSIMSSGLLTMYTEAAIRAEMPASEQVVAIRRAGPNLHGDFDRLGLALARVVQHHGHDALAVKAIGACDTATRSSFSTEQIETILELARVEIGDREIDSLMAAGAVTEQSDLYRELWAVLESVDRETEPRE